MSIGIICSKQAKRVRESSCREAGSVVLVRRDSSLALSFWRRSMKHYDPVSRCQCDNSNLRQMYPKPPNINRKISPFAHFQKPEVKERPGWIGRDGKTQVVIRWDIRLACSILNDLCLHPEEPNCKKCLHGLTRLLNGCDHAKGVEVVGGAIRCPQCWEILDVLEDDDPREMDDHLEDDDPHESLSTPGWSDYTRWMETRLA